MATAVVLLDTGRLFFFFSFSSEKPSGDGTKLLMIILAVRPRPIVEQVVNQALGHVTA